MSLLFVENRRETREHEIVLVLVARTLHMRACARMCIMCVGSLSSNASNAPAIYRFELYARWNKNERCARPK